MESELPLNEPPVTIWAFVRFVARVDFPVTIEGRRVGQLLFADFALDDNLPVGSSSLGSFWRTATAGTGLRWRLHRGLRGRRAGNRLQQAFLLVVLNGHVQNLQFDPLWRRSRWSSEGSAGGRAAAVGPGCCRKRRWRRRGYHGSGSCSHAGRVVEPTELGGGSSSSSSSCGLLGPGRLQRRQAKAFANKSIDVKAHRIAEIHLQKQRRRIQNLLKCSKLDGKPKTTFQSKIIPSSVITPNKSLKNNKYYFHNS